MIKFFRKIRRNLLQKNRVGKYLLYAFGEIILVVIGILIALQLNNINEEKANEQKIISILKEVQKDLKTNIKRAIQYYDDYIELDSTQNIIMNDLYTYNDYKEGRARNIGNLYRDFVPLKNGWEELNNNLNLVPKKYGSIVNQLKLLHTIGFSEINTYNQRIKKTVYDHIDFIYKKDWALDYERGVMSDKLINFFLHDPQYKSYLIKYLNDRRNLAGETQLLKSKAINLYKEISNQIGVNENLSEFMKIEDKYSSDAKTLIGHYKLVKKIGDNYDKEISITQNDKYLFITFLPSDFKERLVYHKKNILNLKGRSTYIKVQEDQISLEFGIGGRAIYTKIKNK